MLRRTILFLLLAVSFFTAAANGQTRAGRISAIVPTGYVQRGSAPEQVAERLLPVFWRDSLRTDRGGRMRVRLDDGSILNVGSESRLQILEHDAPARRTRIQLTYGRMRASVVRIAQAAGDFEVRTPIAVAGVVGTRFSVSITPEQHTVVVALDGRVRVRNADPSVAGEVVLSPGQFTHVERGRAPAAPAAAPPEMLREAEELLDVPAPTVTLSRVELSWPPAACGTGTSLGVRAWKKEQQEGKETESPLAAEEISGRLRLGDRTYEVEAGQVTLEDAPSAGLPAASFTLAGQATSFPVKVWEPVELGTSIGEGWHAPRAVLAGTAFAVRGPVGAARVELAFGPHAAQLLWQGPCGAGFLAPVAPGREYDVTLRLDGVPAARGLINLIAVATRAPVPPAVVRGMTSQFGVEIAGLENLAAHTGGRPVMVVTITNRTPAILGNLRASTRGAVVRRESIIYAISSVAPGGIARLEASGTGRGRGVFQLDVDYRLDSALSQPRTPLSAVQARP